MKKARKSGCQSVTITGGGEPLCHPDIVKIIKDIKALGIKIGLVTNGTLVHTSTLDESFWSCITWCRISSGDHRIFDDSYEEQLESAVSRGPNVDWAFSHVLTSKPNYETIRRVVQFANKHDNFTHIRLVSDLLNLKDVPAMDQIKSKLYEAKVDDTKIIYQGRKDATQGTKRCLISLLKPVIGTNGMLYPCCGTQYAQATPSKDFGGAEMTMGSAKDIDKIFNKQQCFDGSKCATCYYSEYNKSLEILVDKIKHKEFV
jgi:organic radical activating enzyme